MKSLFFFLSAILLVFTGFSQSPQKISYQAVIRNAAGQLVSNKAVGVQISILQGQISGTVVYAEIHNVSTNVNGLLSLEIGNGSPITGVFSDIDWANGPYYLKSETDPSGGTTYSITGTSQLLSVPYALYAAEAANGFSGDYNDLINKPITDGSETKIQAGSGTTISGTGTIQTPYIITCGNNQVVITSTQTWTVPQNISKIKVELWGGSGGGGGAGAYSYSLRHGGDGGSGGYAMKEIPVTSNQQYYVIIGSGGDAGSNAYYYNGNWIGDVSGGNGTNSWFEAIIQASGGTGGKRGSYNSPNINGNAGTLNIGDITGYSEFSNNNILDVFEGIPRSYIHNRVLTSRPGRGGEIEGYSTVAQPSQGEAGCAIITFLE
jgi:hypothetical protein